MKTWILAAGLLSIVPLSNAMLWLNPPPPVSATPASTKASHVTDTGSYGACALRKKLGLTLCGEQP
jgi:hypothetical protein